MRFTQNRELSWLNFNKRVLQMGQEPSTPLFERMKFVSIYQSNLAEFFMIRVGGLHDVAALKKEVIDNASDMTATEQLDAIYKACVPLEELRDIIFADVESQLWSHKVRRYTWEGLNSEQRKFIDEYASKYIFSILSPQIIDPRHPFPHLQNGVLYVVVELTIPPDEEPAQSSSSKSSDKSTEGKSSKKKKAQPKVQASIDDRPLIGIIPVSSMVPRAIRLPGDSLDYILAEEVISHYAVEVFDMYDVGDASVVSVTRNADINPDDETYDDDDYRKHMKKILKKRKRLAPVRLTSQGLLSQKVEKYLCEQLDLTEEQAFRVTAPIDLSYVFDLESKLTPDQAAELLYKPFEPVFPANIDRNRSMFDQLREHDIMLSYPYDSMEPFLMLLREAAHDPDVVSIKITLYRMASMSKVAEYLIAAADADKDVVVLLELRARFDEEANIEWAERFEESGCTVQYGFEGYKVHSKICQITRRKDNGFEFFTQMATGNYNEKTATQYSDISLMTADGDLGFDGVTFFNNMAMGNLDGQYRDLWVSPTSFKTSISEAIDGEIEKAQSGGIGSIIIKCNSVTDLDLIDKLAEASRAGVHIELIVRGICCLLPGIAGETENINVTSIVGRMLEHSRIYCFGEGDDQMIYLGSADIMTRNTERRVEIAFPVKDENLRKRVRNMLEILLSDTDRARKLLPDGNYVKVSTPDGSDPINAQYYFMQEALQRAVVSKKSEEVPAKVEPEEVVTVAGKGFFAKIGAALRRLFGHKDKQLESGEPAALIGQGAEKQAASDQKAAAPVTPLEATTTADTAESEPAEVDPAEPDPTELEEIASEVVDDVE